MSNLLQKIEEHKKLFPLADLSGQLIKLEEEFNEVETAETLQDRIEEIADCIICCIGIYRFAPKTSQFIIKSIVSENNDNIVDIYEAVENKWKVSLNLKWEYTNGKYHHV